MWLSSGSSSVTEIVGIVLGGLFTVFAAVAAGLFALRGSARNTDAEREKNFDERVDNELAALRQELANQRAENGLLRRRLDVARYYLSTNGIDPKLID